MAARARPPATVVAYAAEVVVVLVALLVVGRSRHELLFGAPILIAATAGLVYGVWAAWLFLTLVAAAGAVDALYPELEGWTLVVNGTMLALLAAPPTWRHARRGRPDLFRRR